MTGIMYRTSAIIFMCWILTVHFFVASAQDTSHVSMPKAKKAFDHAMIYWKSSDIDKAEKELKKAISIDPSFPEPYILLGDISYDRENFDDAVEYYKKAIALNSKDGVAYFRLATAYNAVGNYVEAINAANSCLAHKANYAPAHMQLGDAYKKLKQLDNAIKEYTNAAKDPKYRKAAEYEIDLLKNPDKYSQ